MNWDLTANIVTFFVWLVVLSPWNIWYVQLGLSPKYD
jgi:hypothetical protein